MKKYAHNIGIGITTHNRYDVFLNSFNEIVKLSPKGAKIVVVDDASERAVPQATFRFNTNVGIATAKNKCMELLDDCEHIFLFDDDTYPKVKDWHLPYINSGQVHLMYLFRNFVNRKLYDSALVYQDDDFTALSHPRGCMLYIHNSVLDVVGGMDTEYRRWGYEHVDFSNRIYNMGLTPFRFMDVSNSKDLIYSGDEHESVETTVSHEERREYIHEMKPKYIESFSSKKYCRYKSNLFIGPKHPPQVVITTFMNAIPDPQRMEAWKADANVLKPLILSNMAHETATVVLTNCFDESSTPQAKFARITQSLNPYIQRWLAYWQYLNQNPEIRFAFLVDATDVKMLNFPFDKMHRDRLYIGSENSRLNNQWVVNTTRGSQLIRFIRANRNLTLLNCGLVGGSRELLMQLCRDIYENYIEHNPNEHTDMPILNFLGHTKYKDIINFGGHINTVFKANQEVSEAWFKHK